MKRRDDPLDPESWLAELRNAAAQPAPEAARAQVAQRLAVTLGGLPAAELTQVELQLRETLRPRRPGSDFATPPQATLPAPAPPPGWLAGITANSPWLPIVAVMGGVALGGAIYAAQGSLSAPPDETSLPSSEPTNPKDETSKSEPHVVDSLPIEPDVIGPDVVTRSLASASEARSGAEPVSSAPRVVQSRPARKQPTGSGHQALLDEARVALAGGEPVRALAALDDHRRLYPQSSLGEERDALQIQILVAAGRREEALERTTRFEKAHPDSLLLPALRRSVQRSRDGNPALEPIHE